jgi:hypothetical protein
MKTPAKLKPREVYLMANGDLRASANQKCWPEQARTEAVLAKALQTQGWKVVRAHSFDKTKRHGFIDSQKMGMEVFRRLDPDAPLIVVECVWQYSHHLLPGLSTQRGPILTIANWSGTWPGLVGLLNLNASMTKADIRYSSLWSEDFKDGFFKKGLCQWLTEGMVTHDQSHVRDLALLKLPSADEQIGTRFARKFKQHKAILGVFDEGCMGMFNAIIPDELLHPTGVFKERLSQSTLYAAMLRVTDSEAREVLRWLQKKGMRFCWGEDEATELTENQTLQQCKMYIAATRLADEFGCAAIGIQYQQGLKDLVPASDLVEGLLNNVDRPPVKCASTGRVLLAGEALPHFNEVDECAGLDGLLTYWLWRALGFQPENTLHDLRWGQHYHGPAGQASTPPVKGGSVPVVARAGSRSATRTGQLKGSPTLDNYVWVFLISGAAPPAHFIGGYRGASSERQPAMYFALGGGSLKGISKPGHIVWSRVFIMNRKLHCDIGVGQVVELPRQETERRWRETTPQWPIMHAVLGGITRDQMMARHKSNHVQVVYAPSAEQAHRAARIKAAAMAELGLHAHLCGNVKL